MFRRFWQYLAPAKGTSRSGGEPHDSGCWPCRLRNTPCSLESGSMNSVCSNCRRVNMKCVGAGEDLPVGNRSKRAAKAIKKWIADNTNHNRDVPPLDLSYIVPLVITGEAAAAQEAFERHGNPPKSLINSFDRAMYIARRARDSERFASTLTSIANRAFAICRLLLLCVTPEGAVLPSHPTERDYRYASILTSGLPVLSTILRRTSYLLDLGPLEDTNVMEQALGMILAHITELGHYFGEAKEAAETGHTVEHAQPVLSIEEIAVSPPHDPGTAGPSTIKLAPDTHGAEATTRDPELSPPSRDSTGTEAGPVGGDHLRSDIPRESVQAQTRSLLEHGQDSRASSDRSTTSSMHTVSTVGPSKHIYSDPPRAEAALPDRLPSQGRMCVSVDFGTVWSGVACGIYTVDSVRPILWPGSNRKIPTCLVYDPMGVLRAWGFDAQNFPLKEGWTRCEMFKLYFDPTLRARNILPPFPPRKEAIDLVTDYLTWLWVGAKAKIFEAGYTPQDLKSADIWISIPAIWSVESGEMMREAALKAGLVAHQGSSDYSGGRDRLHIIAEPEAAAVHCALWNNPDLKPGQTFMVCDAGGGTVDTAIYQLLGSLTQIAELCASSGSSCGSHFLDLAFRFYLEQWHQHQKIPLSETNLAHYMHSFTYVQKLAYSGEEEDGEYFYFECYDPSLYPPSSEFANGQLIVRGDVFRKQIFDPIIRQVLNVLETQLSRTDSVVNALLLVGGFSGSPYLCRCIQSAFGSRIEHILIPRDADIATTLGAAQSGIERGLVRRPLNGPTIIAAKSYIIGAELPATADDRRLQGAFIQRTRRNVEVCVSRTRYLVVKGALLKKGEPVLKKSRKICEDPFDNVFLARFYSSERAEMEQYVTGGDLAFLRTWEINLSDLPSFRHYARNPHPEGLIIDFELGIEIDSVSVQAIWVHEGVKRGAVVLESFA